ncbi:MAG: hypothetical protein ABIF77_03075 [bacterium]
MQGGTYSKRSLWLLLTMCWLLANVPEGFASGVSESQQISWQEAFPFPDDDDLVVLEVLLERYRVSQGMIGFACRDDVMLPLGELTAALDLAIEVQPEAGRATGWCQREDRTFELDLASGTVILAGRRTTIAPGNITVDDIDIYITTELLSHWLELDIDYAPSLLLVRLTPRTKLPFQQRLKRDQLRSSRLGDSNDPDAGYPLRVAEYRQTSWPLLDTRLQWSGQQGLKPEFMLLGSGDFVGLSAQAYLSRSPGADPTHGSITRINLQRRVAEGGPFGILDGAEVGCGDIFVPGRPLLLSGAHGRGLTVSNIPARRNNQYASRCLQGDAPPGWEVELYHNGFLIDFQIVADHGQYLFPDVPISFGTNVLRVVLYGPQGQVRERVERNQVGADMILPGQVQYSWFSLQNDRSLLGEVEVAEPAAAAPWTHHAEIRYGLHVRHSVGASLTRLPGTQKAGTAFGLTSCHDLAGMQVQSNSVLDFRGGFANQVAGSGLLWKLPFTWQHGRFSRYSLRVSGVRPNLSSDTRLRTGGMIRLFPSQPISCELEINSSRFRDGFLTQQDRWQVRLATNVGRLLLAHRVEHTHCTGTTGLPAYLAGEQLVSSRLGAIDLRGQIRYSHTEVTRIESLLGTVQWRPFQDLSARLSVTRNLGEQAGSFQSLGLTWLRQAVRLGLEANFPPNAPVQVGISVTTSLGRDPRSGHWHVQRERMATGCAASVFVYLDRNADGRFDAEDEPLPGVRLKGLTLWRDLATDSAGNIFLPSLPADRRLPVQVEVESLPDPFLIPTVTGLTACGHAGGIVYLEFPVTYSGEIEGSVTIRRHEKYQSQPGLVLELLAADGTVLATTVSEFDGYFLFQKVRPGRYLVRPSASSLARRHLQDAEPLTAVVSPDGGVVAGVDLRLLPVGERGP